MSSVLSPPTAPLLSPVREGVDNTHASQEWPSTGPRGRPSPASHLLARHSRPSWVERPVRDVGAALGARRTLEARMGPAGDQIGKAVRQWDRVREFARSFPAAFEDFPWGVPVVKIATGWKWPPLFLWLGARDVDAPAVYVKLTDSYEQAVAIAGAFPTAMSGVGQWSRLTVPLPVSDVDLLFDWVDESYRNVAPKRFVAMLDSHIVGR